MKSKIAVLIPIHKELTSHTSEERALLEQTKKVFKDRPLFLFGPDTLASSFSLEKPFEFRSFDGKYFKDKFTYSKLLCSLEFYESFAAMILFKSFKLIVGFLRTNSIILPPADLIMLERLG